MDATLLPHSTYPITGFVGTAGLRAEFVRLQLIAYCNAERIHDSAHSQLSMVARSKVYLVNGKTELLFQDGHPYKVR